MRILLLHRTDDAETRTLAGRLRCHFPEAGLQRRRVPVPLREPLDDVTADLVVVAESHPDTWSAAEADHLLSSAPLARWLVCGSWHSQAAARTRRNWPPSVHRVRSEWASAFAREAAAMRVSSPPLPLSASRDESYAFRFGASPERPATSRRIGLTIDTPDVQLGRMLSEWRAERGWVTAEADITIHVCDADPWHLRRDEIFRTAPGVPLLLLTAWPDAALRKDAAQRMSVEICTKLAPLAEWESAVLRLAAADE